MYLDTCKIRSGNKVYTRVLLRESYREDGKVKHRTIANLSNVRCSPFTVRRSPFAVRAFAVHRSPFAVRAFAVRRSPFNVRRSPFGGARGWCA